MDIRGHLVDGTFGTSHLCGCGQLIFHTSTIDSHVVLTLGSFHLSLHSLVVGIHLITLLGTHDAFVVKALNTVIRLFCYLKTGLSLLENTIGTLNLFLARTVLCFQFQSGRCTLCTLCLLHLGTYLWGIDDGQGVACLYIVTFLDTKFKNTTRHLTRHPILGYFYLSLNDIRITIESEISDKCHNNHDCHKTDNGRCRRYGSLSVTLR